MSFTKALSSISLAALLFVVSGSSSGFAQQTTSPIVAAKGKILTASQPKTTSTTITSTSTVSNTAVQPTAGDNNNSNNPGKCNSKTNPKCNPVSPSS